jgi:hypothetical protein
MLKFFPSKNNLPSTWNTLLAMFLFTAIHTAMFLFVAVIWDRDSTTYPGLEFSVLTLSNHLPQYPKCWNYKACSTVPSWLPYFFFFKLMLIVHCERVHCYISIYAYNVFWSYLPPLLLFLILPLQTPTPFLSFLQILMGFIITFSMHTYDVLWSYSPL